MTRRVSIGMLFPVLGLTLVLGFAAAASARMQTKTGPIKPVTPINKTQPKATTMKPLDINSASEEEIVAVGMDKATAKKVIEGRPYRNKVELVSRSLLTRDQYDKLKDSLVAKQPPKPAK
jgi:competence protein ComEA